MNVAIDLGFDKQVTLFVGWNCRTNARHETKIHLNLTPLQKVQDLNITIDDNRCLTVGNVPGQYTYAVFGEPYCKEKQPSVSIDPQYNAIFAAIKRERQYQIDKLGKNHDAFHNFVDFALIMRQRLDDIIAKYSRGEANIYDIKGEILKTVTVGVACLEKSDPTVLDNWRKSQP